jgi:hypothetical protein
MDYELTVTHDDGRQATSVGAIEFPPHPVIASVSPTEAPATGGTTFTITGELFAAGMAVQFGDRPAVSTEIRSATEIVAVSPSMITRRRRSQRTERVDLHVTHTDGRAAILPDAILFTVETEPEPPEPPIVGTGEHAYFEMLQAREDCFAAYSLRDDAQVMQYSTYLGPRDLRYVYPDDPDPRRQDAMRMLTPPTQQAPVEGLKLPSGSHHPANLFTVEERWWGAEYGYANHQISYYKGDPYFDSGPTAWIATKTVFAAATQNTHTLPPGGPFVLMLNPQFINGSSYKYSYPTPVRLPYNALATAQRSYGNEGAGPRDTSAGPAGAEFGVVAERWTRIFHFFERAAEEDWSSTSNPAGPRTAYRWSMWAADTERDPIRILDRVVMAIYPNTDGFRNWRMHMGVGNAYQEIAEGRGSMLAYARNVVILHGTPANEIPALLLKPTTATPAPAAPAKGRRR